MTCFLSPSIAIPSRMPPSSSHFPSDQSLSEMKISSGTGAAVLTGSIQVSSGMVRVGSAVSDVSGRAKNSEIMLSVVVAETLDPTEAWSPLLERFRSPKTSLKR